MLQDLLMHLCFSHGGDLQGQAGVVRVESRFGKAVAPDHHLASAREKSSSFHPSTSNQLQTFPFRFT